MIKIFSIHCYFSDSGKKKNLQFKHVTFKLYWIWSSWYQIKVNEIKVKKLVGKNLIQGF